MDSNFLRIFVHEIKPPKKDNTPIIHLKYLGGSATPDVSPPSSTPTYYILGF